MLRLKDKIEANVTYSDHAGTADSAKVATKLGSAGVGNMANFIYLNAGIPTASNSTIGGSTVPIYMKSGVMTQCIYSLKDACSKSVRTKSSIGDSGWKDNATDDGYVPTMSFMAYWNGAYSGSSSNLTYCKYGAFGSIVTKNSGDYAPASHSHAWSTITEKPALMEAGDYSADTIHDLLVQVQGISPRMGSTYITKETHIPNTWYNFIYTPHRTGIGGDNPDYGTLLLFAMTGNEPSYIIRAGKSGSIGRLCKIYTDGDKPSKSDVGLGNVDNTADSAKSVKYAASAGSAGSAGYVAWSNVGGKPSSYPPSDHSHSYLPLSGGTISGNIEFSGIGDTGKSAGLSWYGSTDGAGIYYQTTGGDQGNLVLNLTDDDNCYLRIAKNGSFTAYVTPNGAAYFSAVYNAVYNDYAEFFPRGEATEPGDIVALDLTADHESYIKATATSKIVAGVHSDEYAMLIGGDKFDDGNYVEKNIEKYIPVSLCGRVFCKCSGKIHRGDTIVVSDIPGIGRAKLPNDYVENTQIVGYAVDEDMSEEIRRVRIRVKG